jgi:hypothetical protein
MGTRVFQPTGDARSRAGRDVVLASGSRHAHPPQPPAWLDRRARELFRQAWRLEISTLWDPRSHTLIVARWSALMARVEREAESCAASLFAQLRALEADLMLSPKAQRQARILVESPASAEPVADLAEIRRLLGREVEAG